jgi:hypothetical protein
MNQSSSKPKSSPALLSATGRDYAEWFQLLDAWGAPGRGYREIADWLVGQGFSDWWAQKLIVEYEQDRGLRQPGARTGGLVRRRSQQDRSSLDRPALHGVRGPGAASVLATRPRAQPTYGAAGTVDQVRRRQPIPGERGVHRERGREGAGNSRTGGDAGRSCGRAGQARLATSAGRSQGMVGGLTERPHPEVPKLND